VKFHGPIPAEFEWPQPPRAGQRRRGFGKLEVVDIPNPEHNYSEVSEDGNLPVESAEGRMAALTAERDQLAAAKADLEDRLLRARAEFDNARRRGERERSDSLQFAGMDLVKELLPVVDDFERALKVQTADCDYARGVELIYQRLVDALKKIGLEPIDTAGRRFDPNLHQAVDRVETDEAGDMAILSEYQRGYNFRGKLLRPAMVRVAVRP
jgi:molecular chaperone GrpE